MSVEIKGLKDLDEWMRNTAPDLSKKLAGDMVFDVAKAIADQAKEYMPVDTGLLKAATKPVRVSAGGKPSAGVAVRGPRASASNPFGYAFYWYILEYGDGPDKKEHAMFRRAEEKVKSGLDRVEFAKFRKRLTDAIR